MFAALPGPWWLAGGYAIELAVGHAFRHHDDIDVLVLRRDQLAAQEALKDWDWWAADPPGTLRPWLPGETLPTGVHDIWCRPAPDEPWRLQLMLDESAGEDWVSRRDPGVRLPIAALGRTSLDGLPHLTPEVQLFYKARAPRPKDDADFTAVLPLLTNAQRTWLADVLTDVHGTHPWLARLTARP